MAKTKKTKGEHYVDNKVFLQAMTDWKVLCKIAEEDQKDLPKEEKVKPQVTNYIGECFLKIATHLSYRPNFINYQSWTVNEGDTNRYVVQGFDPNIMLPDEDVYKPKKKIVTKTKGLENFMEDDEDEHDAVRGID